MNNYVWEAQFLQNVLVQNFRINFCKSYNSLKIICLAIKCGSTESRVWEQRAVMNGITGSCSQEYTKHFTWIKVLLKLYCFRHGWYKDLQFMPDQLTIAEAASSIVTVVTVMCLKATPWDIYRNKYVIFQRNNANMQHHYYHLATTPSPSPPPQHVLCLV